MSAWDRLAKQVAVEVAQLRRLVDSHRPLIEACGTSTPDTIGLSALAAMLHSFYNGVENLFKRVATKIDGGLPTTKAWHRRLLNSMANPTGARPALISASLRDAFRGDLDFRHFFRHAYTFDLRWSKMGKLVRECESTLANWGRMLCFPPRGNQGQWRAGPLRLGRSTRNSIVMGVTGFVLWFPGWSMRHMPKLALDVAAAIHGYEAALAFLAIIIWHLYSVIFSPDVWPMSKVWLTGEMTEEEMEHHHPLELEKLKETEKPGEKGA